MIIDSETNILYLADCLGKKFPEFCNSFETTLAKYSVQYHWLPGTKDVWARDYMPIQVAKDKFIVFTYNPSYLQNKTWVNSISDAHYICNLRSIPVSATSRILLDGGNVVKYCNKAIITDRIFNENPGIGEKDIIGELENLLEIDKVIIIPSDPADFTGHADGMVRFIDEHTVIINGYAKQKDKFQAAFRMSLHNVGLDWEELPYNPYLNKPNTSACGIYVNYLQMKDFVFIPVFGMKEDETAIKKFEELFTNIKVIPVQSSDLAKKGGILNCISWNIYSDKIDF